MMEFLYELRSTSGLCKLFDFFDEASTAMQEMITKGEFRCDELYISRVVTE